jgi:hypothetical protein
MVLQLLTVELLWITHIILDFELRTGHQIIPGEL